MRRALLLLGVFLIGCGPDDLQSRLKDDSPEVLAEILPGHLFTEINAEKTMLPASKTEVERVARAKADSWDPRDNHPYYTFTGTPGDVYGIPAESEPVQALLVGWPGGASGLTSFFAKLIKSAAPTAGTTVVYTSQSAYSSLYYQLQSAGADLDRISFVGMDLDTIWIRDYGPLLAKTASGYRVIDFRYYYGRWNDDVAPTRLAKAWNVPVSRPPLEAEGGNFQSDGAGRCITTDMMLYENKERGYTSQDIKSIFKKYLGCQTTVILPSLAGEGTGHVDMLATITGPGEVIVGDYPANEDPTNAKRLDSAASMLKSAGFKVRRVPMPSNWDNNFRSYTNSLAVGNRVLLPVYSDDSRFDSQAISVFKQAYPGRTIIPIDATKIITWAGAIHCVTMTLGL